MPSGYFDSVAVPLHLPPSAYKPVIATGKGKAKETGTPSSTYHVVEQWTEQERDDMLRKVAMASLRPFLPLSRARAAQSNADTTLGSRLLDRPVDHVDPADV